jgi:hypothetical protein
MRLAIVLALASSAAMAQVHGTPASVTSLAPSGTPSGAPMVIRGVPSSVTSLGPQGFTPHPRVFPAPVSHVGSRGHFGGKFDGRFSGRFGSVGVPVYVPVYYGYGYGYYDYDSAARQQQELMQQQFQQQQLLMQTQQLYQQQDAQKLEITVVDKRDQAKRDAENEAAVAEASKPKQSNLSEPPRDPAIFIFKDGSRKELGNFAIMSGMLYDLSENKVRKYALNTLNRQATLAANAEAGREITLP